MVSYHSQLITSHKGISDVFKPPESCRSGRGQTDSQFPILSVPSLPFHSITSLHLCQLECLYIFLRPPWKKSSKNKHRHTDVGAWTLNPSRLVPPSSFSSSCEWNRIVRAQPIPALLNGFTHRFRFSWNAPPPTALDSMVPSADLFRSRRGNVMSPLPWAGPTFTLIGNKKWLKSFFSTNLWWNVTVCLPTTLKSPCQRAQAKLYFLFFNV